MTPQQTGKAPLRNTSPVPRTRKTVVSTAIEIEEEHQPISVAAKASETPHSIPLPPSVETPYEAPVARVSPQIALTTPRGPVSLHKALLLRSARKAWENNRSPGLEGAIEAGDVEVRRKSLSPKRKSPKKSLTPMPLANDAEDEEHEEVEEAEDGELQWIHEDGQAKISADDSDSDMDSFEADLSLDIVSVCLY